MNKASVSGSLYDEFSLMKKKLRVRLTLAFIFFFLLSGFFCLYLMGFSELANRKSEEDWLMSSFISIGIDMTAF